MSEESEVYYRYDDPYDEEGPIWLSQHIVTRRTPKGVWLWAWGVEKFVLDGEGKRFAYPTKELARQSYIKRKRRAVALSARQHDRQKTFLDLAAQGEWGEVFALGGSPI